MADTLNEYFFSLVKTKGFNYQGGRMSIDCLNIIDSLYLILFDISIFFPKLSAKFHIKTYSFVFPFRREGHSPQV